MIGVFCMEITICFLLGIHIFNLDEGRILNLSSLFWLSTGVVTVLGHTAIGAVLGPGTIQLETLTLCWYI